VVELQTVAVCQLSCTAGALALGLTQVRHHEHDSLLKDCDDQRITREEEGTCVLHHWHDIIIIIITRAAMLST
jgi:hypothetical protein